MPAPGAAARIEAAMPRLLAEGEVPGLAVALVEDGRVAWVRGFGFAHAERRDPVTERTVFEAASLSKPVVAYAALRLADEGRLELDAPLTRYVPEPYVRDDPRLGAITARHVLTHSSGLPNGRAGGAPLRIHFAPGERFSYSGEGFLYLQAALERITGEPLDALARRLAFGPLGMESSSFVWQERFDTLKAYAHGEAGAVTGRRKATVASAAASLETTAADYARFVAAALAGTGLRAETHRAMLRAQLPADSSCVVCAGRPAGAPSASVGWGLGWGISPAPGGDTFLWHWGDNGDAKAYVAALHGARRGVVIFANGAGGLAIAPEIAALALGTDAPGFPWLGYDRYDSPIRAALRDVLARGGAAVAELAARQRGTSPFTEAEVNGLGYRLLARGRPREAVQVLRINAERFPASANTHDSLGEALLAAGDTAGAVAAYRRATALDPASESAAAALRRLTRPVVRVAPAVLDAYTGTYTTPMGPLVVTRDAEGLLGVLGEEGAARLVPESATRFSVGGGSNTVEFFPTHAIIRAGGQEIRAPRNR